MGSVLSHMGVWGCFLAAWSRLRQSAAGTCLWMGTLTHRLRRGRFPETFCVNQLAWGRGALPVWVIGVFSWNIQTRACGHGSVWARCTICTHARCGPELRTRGGREAAGPAAITAGTRSWLTYPAKPAECQLWMLGGPWDPPRSPAKVVPTQGGG